MLIQIGAKLNHEPWKFKNLPLVSEQQSMVVGMSICHKIGRSNSSVLTLVANTDSSMTQPICVSEVHKKKEQICLTLKSAFMKLLLHFKDANGVLPSQIIIYRSSVGEGQTPAILNIELPQISKCFEDLNINPKTLFILANTHVEIRFSKKEKNNWKNPEGGFIVDSQNLNQEHNIFFGVPHSSVTGLQCPVKYQIIYNNWEGLVQEQLYELTNSLCYGYHNHPAACKLPYQLVLAQRLGNFIATTSHHLAKVQSIPEGLKTTQYFI